ncbi:MAG: hypothetical protein IVW57_03150 [Ktedonobacterales bacterium]|nr:hypothetical protein [Ktedonobacterales bacterium]
MGATTMPSWPADDGDKGNDGDGNGNSSGNKGSRASGSGPLGDAPPQITAALQARLTHRFSQPFAHGERDETDATDEYEILSDDDLRAIRRYRQPAAPSPAWMRAPTAASLPPLPDFSMDPPRPLARGPSPVAAQPQPQRAPQVAVLSHPRQPEAPMPMPMPAPAYAPPYAPVNVTRLVLKDFHIALLDDYLPANVLALLDTHDRRIVLAPALAPLIGVSAALSSASYPRRLEQVIEARPLTRFVLAALYVRWHARMPDGAPDGRGYVCALAPATGLLRHAWHRWHAALYTRLYAQTCRLVAPITGQLSATYLGVRGGSPYDHYGIPRIGPDLHAAVAERALAVLPALRASCATPREFRQRAWDHYAAWLAHNAGVPTCVPRDRLRGDTRIFSTPDDLCQWTDELLADTPDVGEWRIQTARAFGITSATTRAHGYRTAAQQVALWLAEPTASAS